MTADVPILPAAADEADSLTDLVAEAFAGLTVTAWLVPEPDQRLPVLRGAFRILVDHALEHGHVDVLADRTGVAVWLHRDRPIPEPQNYEQRLAAACGPHTDRFNVLDLLFERHHPSAPHHHLVFLAVAPAWQCTGRGTALLRHHHAHLDRICMPAYREASTTGSRDLYTRHCYETQRRFTLPDGTPFWSMWRPPRRMAHEPGS